MPFFPLKMKDLIINYAHTQDPICMCFARETRAIFNGRTFGLIWLLGHHINKAIYMSGTYGLN